MGSPHSGPQPDPNSAKSKSRGILGVVGTGEPVLPDGMPVEVVREWQNLVELTTGITFEQDSGELLRLARLRVRDDAVAKKLDGDPTNEDLNRVSLAIGRQITVLSGRFGLTPKDRQTLQRPKPPDEVKPLSRLEQIRASQASVKQT